MKFRCFLTPRINLGVKKKKKNPLLKQEANGILKLFIGMIEWQCLNIQR